MSRDQSQTTDDLTAWGWAPGEYAGAICHRCAIRHGGYAKGSWRCEWCARAARDTAAKPTDAPKTTIGSVEQLRAALSMLPRNIQREVRLLWGQGHMSAATEIVENHLRAMEPAT